LLPFDFNIPQKPCIIRDVFTIPVFLTLKMASSSQASASVGTNANKSTKNYTNDDILELKPTNRNLKIWCNFDFCIMTDFVKKAGCKRCGRFYVAASNSILRSHMSSSCKALNQENTYSMQPSIWPDCGYNTDDVREAFCKFDIQEALPFDHFDNPRLTKIIKEKLQPQITL